MKVSFKNKRAYACRCNFAELSHDGPNEGGSKVEHESLGKNSQPEAVEAEIEDNIEDNIESDHDNKQAWL